jgi:ribosomal protein S18 acetylase RimI-like enzyme
LKNYINIRPLKSSEIESWQIISRQTFRETFATFNTEENMSLYLANNLSFRKLQDEYNDLQSEVFVTEVNEEVIGYLKVNHTKDRKTLEIERIYVLKDFHGQGVGQLLLDKAIAIAKNKNIHLIWLGVWERNPRAIRFYEKNGFVPYGSHVFKLGNDEQCDVLMRLTI